MSVFPISDMAEELIDAIAEEIQERILALHPGRNAVVDRRLAKARMIETLAKRLADMAEEKT